MHLRTIGTDKSHFCEALGQAAVDDGLGGVWFSIDDLGALMAPSPRRRLDRPRHPRDRR